MAGSLNSLLWYSIVNGVPIQLVSAYGGGQLSHAIPALSLSGFGAGRADILIPGITVLAAGHGSSGENDLQIAPGPFTASAFGGANMAASLPAGVLSLSGTFVGVGKGELALPSLGFAGTGTTTEIGKVTSPIPSLTVVGYGGGFSVNVLPTLSAFQATATASGRINLSATLPVLEISAAGGATSRGQLQAVLPSLLSSTVGSLQVMLPVLSLTAIGSAVVTATYEAYATNLKHNPRPGVEPHDEVTHYTNFPFTHVVRYQNSYYGANSTGLYLLEGTTDAASLITWDVKTATTDLKSPQNKTVASAYFGGRLGPADTITLHAGEGAKVQAYSYTTPRGALAQNYRQAFGKGIKSHRYYALEASGTGELALDDISLDVHNLSRRI